MAAYGSTPLSMNLAADQTGEKSSESGWSASNAAMLPTAAAINTRNQSGGRGPAVSVDAGTLTLRLDAGR